MTYLGPMNNSKTKQINDNIMNDYLILWYLTFDIFKQKETSSAVLATFLSELFDFDLLVIKETTAKLSAVMA